MSVFADDAVGSGSCYYRDIVKTYAQGRHSNKVAISLAAWLFLKRHPIASAIVWTATAAAARWTLAPVLGDMHPYGLVYLSVAVCAGLLGWQAGLVSAFFGFATAQFLFVQTESSQARILGAIICVVNCSTMIGLAASLQRSLAKTRSLMTKVAESNDQLEERVAKRTEELSALNERMQAFTYMVAHDLRGPLRAIMSTSRILMEDDLDETEMRSLLERQTSNSKRLSQLIDDLLNTSRLNQSKINRQPLDVTEMALAVGDEIALAYQRRADLVVHPEMTATGDPTLVGIVLQNLIGNAFKYSKSGTVEVKMLDGTVCVEDCGIGFEMEYADKIFDPFHRLVRSCDYDGSGIGLYNVKHIVERHGGKVWADSVPGVGTRIYFTLQPNHQPCMPLFD